MPVIQNCFHFQERIQILCFLISDFNFFQVFSLLLPAKLLDIISLYFIIVLAFPLMK